MATDRLIYVSEYNSPLTTKGDVFTHNATTEDRLGVGTNGQVIVADSTDPLGIKWDAGSFLVDNADDTTTGTLTAANFITTGYVSTNEVRPNTNAQLVINAGESHIYATGQIDEYVYINAEAGLQISSSPDNWATGWAGRNTAVICDASGNSAFPGVITAHSFSTSDYHYRSVKSQYLGIGAQTGTLKITLPNSWSNTMLKFKIEGYDHLGSTKGRSWSVEVDGYNYSATPGWYHYDAHIHGYAPFNSVRLAHDGTKNCILLGITSSTWNYATIHITDVIATYSNQNLWRSGYTISLITSEVGITNSVTPVIGFIMDTSGQIGINDSSPSYGLDVNGTGRFTGNLLLDSAFGFSTAGITTIDRILDEDTMTSNSAVALATQQSIKAYVDSSSVSTGTDNQIPFVNSAGTDFDYSANFTWNGTTLTITNAEENACVGVNAGNALGVSSSNNTIVGSQAGRYLTVGFNNALFGYQAGGGSSNTGGDKNTYLGAYTGLSNITDSNVFIGYQSGYYETGSNKLFIDNQTRTNEATSRTSSMLYGEFNATVTSQVLRMNGKFGVNATPSTYTLDVTGNARFSLGTISAGQINGTTVTPTTIWDALTPCISNTGDIMNITGSIYVSTNRVKILAYAERYNSTTVRLHYMDTAAGVLSYQSIIDAGAGTLRIIMSY